MITNENYSHNDKSLYDQQQDQFYNWCDKWDKAQEDGIFDNAPKAHIPTQNMGSHSFFGPVDAHSNDGVDDVDSTYWNQVYAMSTGQGPDPMEVIAEGEIPPTEIIADEPPLKPAPGWSKEDATASHKVSKKVGTAANPIYPNTVGKDQDLKPAQLDATFSERDIVELAEMKLKLYALESKLNAAEGNSKSGNRFATQIENLKNQIDELSDRMARTHPDQSAP